MNNRTKAKILIWALFLSGFLSGFLVRGCFVRHDREEETVSLPADADNTELLESQTESSVIDEPEAEDSVSATDTVDLRREIVYYAPKMSYSKTFCDVNEEHVKVASSIGLQHIPENHDDVPVLKGIVAISDNDCYVIDKLRYSVPYLTKGGAKELDRIARAFSDSLESKGFPAYKLVVTSMLRTEQDVRRLQRSGNPNATDNSAHCYGTTFDITYTRFFREEETDEFMQPYELTKVLAQVLRDEREAGRCLVKYERKEHCFHITSKI